MSTTGDIIMLRTKITVPVTRDSLVGRPRLNRLMTRASQGRLTAVCAPAGYGKTTLVSQWVRDSGVAAAWVSLDGTDNDLAKFWRYVVHSLSQALPAESLKRALPLAYALPNLSIHTFLDALILELSSGFVPVTVILDDYQVIAESGIHASLAYWIDRLPDNVRVIIASRSELPLPSSKWLAGEERTDITAADLRFTNEEMESVCGKSPQLSLGRRQMDLLLERTEGWATGIQLALLSLRSNPNRDRFIEQFRGNNRTVSDFLFEEVFTALQPDVQRFVLDTSVLDRLDAVACDAVLQRSDSGRMLEKLKADNLFLIPLDDRDIWFRYHQLFSQFLRSQQQRKDPVRWREVHRLASRSFARRGLLTEAIDHAIEGQDDEWAENLLGKHIGVLFRQGEFSTLLRWFGSLPQDADRPPEIRLFYAFILAITGQPNEAESELENVEQQFVAEEDGETRKKIRSGMLFVRSNLIFFSGQFEKWHSFAEGTAAGDMLPENRAFYDFNYNLTEPLVRRTTLGLKGALNSDTETIGRRFVQVLESQGWNDSYINLYVCQSLCEGYYEWNRLEECVDFFRRVENPVNRNKTPGLFVPMRIMQARIHAADGKSGFAHETIDQAVEVASGFPEDHWLGYLLAFKIRLLLAEGEVVQAKKRIGDLQVSEKDHPTLNREFEYLTLVRMLGRQNKFSSALRLLELLKPQAQRESLLTSMAEISILQALLEFQRGHRAAALAYLQEALEIGEANGYIRSFVDEGPAMERLLRYYVEEAERERNPSVSSEPSAIAAYARKILDSFPSQPVPAPSRTAESALIEPLTESETALLNLIRRGSSNRQIADELALSLGTVKVYLSRVYAKLGVSSRTQALNKAEELGLL